MTDSSWKAWSEDDCVEPISCPYYCMCSRWTGSEWETLETGQKPYAINANNQWISASRPASVETFYFDAAGSVNHTAYGVGWTFKDWLKRGRADMYFQTADPPVWPLSTVSGEGRLHVSRGVQITPGKLAVDEPNEEVQAFKSSAA